MYIINIILHYFQAMNPEVITSKFGIYFDYICKTEPKYSDNSEDTYINAYIVELFYDNKQNIIIFINIKNIDENNIDLNEIKNADLIERINYRAIYIQYYPSYDIAKHNLIYIIYFGEPYTYHSNDNYNINIYKIIREKYPYTGDSYYYDKEGNILRKCFHINGSIEGKFYGYHYFYNPLPIDDGEYWEPSNGYGFKSYFITTYDIDYVNGVIHGKYIKYHRNGKIQNELNYVDGKIYNENITIENYNYINGKANGKAYKYNYNYSQETYTLKSDCDYVNDERNGVKNIYEDGKLYRTITYKNNKKNGLSTYIGKTKYGNGYYIQIEKTYKDGKRNGVNKYYNDLGQITMTKEYKNDSCYNVTYYYSTGVKKESINIKYDNKTIYGICNICTKEINVIKNYNESGEIVKRKKKTIIIEHDGYEYCNDSDYYDYCDEHTYSYKNNNNKKNERKISIYEYLHFVDI